MKFDYITKRKYGSFGGMDRYTVCIIPENDKDRKKIRELEVKMAQQTKIYGELMFEIHSTSQNNKDGSLRLKTDTKTFRPA